jgi:secondary thiamine-phosphate synthase enzyme
LATGGQTEFFDLTDEVLNYVAESGIKNGHVLIQPLHTTVGIFLNDGESRLIQDFEREVCDRVVLDKGYLHDDIEGQLGCSSGEQANCHSHLKSAFFSNPSLSLVVFGGRLQLGKYQRILFAEFNGPCPREHKSRRRYAVSIIGV